MGPAVALGWGGAARGGHLTRHSAPGWGRGHGGFLSLPSLTLLSNDFSLVLRSIHIHFNLMAHKLLAKWFHYSPSVSYKREKEEQQEGKWG